MSIDKICAQECQNSYNGEHGKAKKSLTIVERFDRAHVEGILGKFGKNGRFWMLVFRGSDGWKDWFDNFKFWKVKTPKKWFGESFRVHDGFYSQWSSVRRIIIDYIKKYEIKEIWITGHSLGGALATLCALDLFVNFGIIIHARMFGSPRVGTSFFSSFYNSKMEDSVSYQFDDDMVCKVPPIWFGYGHIRHVKLGEKEKLLGKILKPITMIFGNPMDHEPQDYVNAMKEDENVEETGNNA